MAAVLACGPAAYLSHSSSGALHDVAQRGAGPIDVSVVSDRVRRHPGLRAHRVGSLTPSDLTVIDGIPTTTVARVLLDLAAEGRIHELGTAIGRAQRAEKLDVTAVASLIERSRGHRGVARLRLETEGLLPYGGVPKSEFERRFRRLFEAHRLPEPVINGLIRLEHCTLQVDFHWPEARLVVEADGYRWHSDKSAHEQDRWRDQELKRAGWEVLRFTWRQLTREPARTARIIAEVLEARLPR
jgi:very-short-patch-repair endonuclease